MDFRGEGVRFQCRTWTFLCRLVSLVHDTGKKKKGKPLVLPFKNIIRD